MSQEWDEVLHEVKLIIERLDAFRDDLLAAADGGDLTAEQCALSRDSTVVAMGCSLCLLELYADAMAEKAEGG